MKTVGASSAGSSFIESDGFDMSLSVGIDLQPIVEVEDSLRTFGARYTRRLFTAHELNGLSGDPRVAARDLAAIFAAKEAVMKVLAPSGDIPSWHDIEVRDVGRGSASVALRGAAAAIADVRAISDIEVRLGFTRECATALAVAHPSKSGVLR
jgi:holo-[acyl-carrier protein] synthase